MPLRLTQCVLKLSDELRQTDTDRPVEFPKLNQIQAPLPAFALAHEGLRFAELLGEPRLFPRLPKANGKPLERSGADGLLYASTIRGCMDPIVLFRIVLNRLVSRYFGNVGWEHDRREVGRTRSGSSIRTG